MNLIREFILHRHTVNSSSVLHCLNLPACPKPCVLYTEFKRMYFLLVRHKLLTCSFLFCSRVLGWICYFSLLGKNRLINHLISGPFDSIIWAPGSVPKPAEVNEKIPLDLPDLWITNWMHDCTVCLAQPKCRGFLQGVGLCTYPSALQFVSLILCLCSRSDQPYNRAKTWSGKEKTQTKQKIHWNQSDCKNQAKGAIILP